MFTTSDFIQSPNSKQSNTKQYVLYTFIFLIILSLGILIGLEIPVIRHRTYTDGWNAAKARLAESEQFGFLEQEREVKTLDGTIEEIAGNQFALRTTPLSPLADPELDIRFVSLTEMTKITRVSARDVAVYQKELDLFMKNAQAGKNTPDTPMPASFTTETVRASDLKVGDRVIITTGENVAHLKKFQALEVQIQ